MDRWTKWIVVGCIRLKKGQFWLFRASWTKFFTIVIASVQRMKNTIIIEVNMLPQIKISSWTGWHGHTTSPLTHHTVTTAGSYSVFIAKKVFSCVHLSVSQSVGWSHLAFFHRFTSFCVILRYFKSFQVQDNLIF